LVTNTVGVQFQNSGICTAAEGDDCLRTASKTQTADRGSDTHCEHAFFHEDSS